MFLIGLIVVLGTSTLTKTRKGWWFKETVKKLKQLQEYLDDFPGHLLL